MAHRKTIFEIQEKKKKHEKIVMLTAYDCAMATIIDQQPVDIILIGDSLANVVLGLESTKDVGMREMLHHAKAVNRGVQQALLVADMPYEAYQENIGAAVNNAHQFIEEAGCDAVKLEWFDQCLEVTERIVSAGIAVMGHVGLTPQSVDKLGGYKVQGTEAVYAQQIIEDAKALEKKGCFSVVLECIPKEVAEIITKELGIPTIGIGAGVHCDGQVLVINDLLGYSGRFKPKFVKQYASLAGMAGEGIREFCDEIRQGQFPGEEHSYHLKPGEREILKTKMSI